MNAEQLIKEFGEKIGLPTLSLDSDHQSAITVGERQIDMCGPPSGMFFLYSSRYFTCTRSPTFLNAVINEEYGNG